MIKKLVVFFTVLIFTGVNVPAQNPFIRHYSAVDGLPSNAINIIRQDYDNFLWFATEGGLVRFDGSNFTSFNTSKGLSSNHVIVVKVDSRNRVWFFCIGELNYYYQGKIFNKHNAPFLDSLKGNWTFSQDKQGNLYFYNYHCRRISVLDTNNNVKHYTIQIDPAKKSSFSPDDAIIRYLVRTPSGEFIFWTFEGIYKTSNLLQKPKKNLDLDKYHNIYPINDSIMYDMVENSALHSSVLVRYRNGTPGDTIHFLGAALDINSTLLEDKNDNLWICSPDKGIFCLQNKKVIYHLDLEAPTWICNDIEGNIWANSKNGAYRISPNVLLFKHFDNSHFGNEGISALSSDPSGQVWGLNGKRIFLYMNSEVKSMDIKYSNLVFKDLLALNYNSLLLWDDISNYLAITGISSFKKDQKLKYKKSYPLNLVPFSGIPTANRNGDIVCFWGYNDLATCSVKNNFKVRDRITIGSVTHVFFDARDNLVVLEPGNHYIIRNKNKIPYNEFAKLTRTSSYIHKTIDSIADVFVSHNDSVYLVKNRNSFNLTSFFDYTLNTPVKKITYQSPVLYLSTFRNLYACDNPLKSEENKSLSLSLIDINFTDIRDIEAVHDTLFIATSDGLTIIPINLLGRIKAKAPLPYFKSVRIDNNELDTNLKRAEMRTQDILSFEFGSINYSDNPTVYSYMLEGFEKEWNVCSVNKVAYGNLPGGHYKFRLRAGKSNSVWSEPIDYEIHVYVTLWRHPLFYVALSIICTAIIFLYIMNRRNVQIKKREIEHQLVSLEQKALQSMMNPHFIFNTLGSIQNFLLQNKSGEAGQYLSQFARLIRQNLNAINAALIILEDETDRLKNYLDLEKMRLPNKFEYQIRMDDSLESDEIYIPSMIVQPFVENAVWHGITQLEGKGNVTVLFQKESEKSLKVTVQDNGIGMKKSAAFTSKKQNHLGLSLDLTLKRLKLLGEKYKVNTTVQFSEAIPGAENPGTCVVIIIPVSYRNMESDLESRINSKKNK